MFTGPGFTLEDAQWLLPFIDVHARDSDLSDADTTQAVLADKTMSLPIMATLGVVDIQEAWSLDESDATGLTAELGYATDPNFTLTALNLIGVAAGLSFLTAGGVGNLIVQASVAAGLVTAGYTPQVQFVATGGATPTVVEADAGYLIARTYFICCPSNLASYGVDA
jgi:hypothetical protein